MLQTFNFNQALRRAHYSEQTIREYHRRARRWLDYLKKHRRSWKKATGKDVARYRASLLRTDRSKPTVNCHLHAVRKFYDLAAQRKLVSRNPVEKVKYFPRSQGRLRMTAAEVKRLTDWYDTLPANLRAGFYAIHGAGLNVIEAAALRADDITREAGTIYITVHHSMCALDRLIPVMEERAARILWAYKQRADPLGPLFGASADQFAAYLRRYVKSHQIKYDLDCHLIRRNYAIRRCEDRLTIPEIQYLMGHSTDTATLAFVRAAHHDVKHLRPDYRIK